MHRRLYSAWFLSALWLALGLPRASGAAAGPKGTISFQRDIRPILSDTCFKCHGPDEGAREAKLRLDTREGALRERNGFRAVVPGRPEDSELMFRITSSDPEERMPPVDKHPKALAPGQIALLRQWIVEGAKWEEHWSFTAPVSPRVPAVGVSAVVRNPIDNFVLARLQQEELALAVEADKVTLLRRVSFDLTGLPPTVEELDAFIADTSPAAYDRVVTRLLDSPRYGERMAADWLDAARYADTNGYFGDATRQAWPWRDWVIDAFNRNMPFDQFTIEQLAGDLLAHPTLEQRIATGFNRNNMTNNESGAIDEEYRVEYVAERLETTGTVWLGMTIGCARCHDHKYDPISQREFYQLFAFFNNAPEKGLVTQDDPPPVMDVATAEQRAELAKLQAGTRAAEEKFDLFAQALREPMAAWERSAASELEPLRGNLSLHVAFEPELPGVVEKGNVTYGPGLRGQAAAFDGMQHLEAPADLPLNADQPWSIGVWLKPTGSLNGVLGKIEPVGDRRGFEIVWQKGRFQINLVHRWGVNAIEIVTREPVSSGDWQQLVVSYDGSGKAQGVRVYIDGIQVPLNIVLDTLTGPIGNAEPLRVGRRDSGLGFYGQLDELRLLARAVGDEEAQAWFWSDRLPGALAVAPEKREPRPKQLLLDYYTSRHADAPARDAYRAVSVARTAEADFRAQLPKTLVMAELPAPRKAYVLNRGQYDQPGEEVSADVPASLLPLPADAPRNRLGLARWLTSPDHPLTARVQVNRMWKQCFGEGIVRTNNDFGSQGEPPTHPELLDWLAVQFMRSGWDTKNLLRLIVTSATYRQSSVASVALLERDPENRLLARGPRFRLPAEMIRDQALLASGLLVERIGGPSVKPYQPPGLWEAVSYNGDHAYQPDAGEGLWRRSLYTFWKRQAPPPGMLTFDSPTRETCAVSRPRTNTPMQALVLLNDETYVEAARALAAVTLANAGPGPGERLSFAFRRATSRAPDRRELQILERLHGQQTVRFEADPEAAKRLVQVGASRVGRERSPIELAVWTAVAQALINLDEAVMRR
ncbi:MAG: DUF1553 domain-containing protein [Verrucomicrobia bacterium]|nr:DUF1553 domain-containing protein [Verrucomicrobiota bacterium]